jgi:hypothetical protein
MATNYRELLDTEAAKLRKLLTRREDLQSELAEVNANVARLREGVFGLAALAGVDLKAESPDLFRGSVRGNVGLTSAIRMAIRGADFPMTPTDIRDYLVDNAYPIREHKNPLASIHSVLNRLIDAGEVVMGTDTRRKKTVYVWKDSEEGSALSLRGEEPDEGEQGK